MKWKKLRRKIYQGRRMWKNKPDHIQSKYYLDCLGWVLDMMNQIDKQENKKVDK